MDNDCIYYSRWFSALDSSSQSGSSSIAFVKVIGPERVYCADMKIVHAHKYYASKNFDSTKKNPSWHHLRLRKAYNSSGKSRFTKGFCPVLSTSDCRSQQGSR